MIPGNFEEIFVNMLYRLEELERRMENRTRTGTIHEVDAKKGTARVKIGEDSETGEPYLSPAVPWKEAAMGNIKFHTPPSVGEQVKLVSESGDITDAVIDTSLPSNQNKRPHDKEDEHVRTVGGTRILEKDGLVHIIASKIVLEGDVHLGGEGGKLIHRKGDKDSAGDLAVDSASKVYAI